MRQLTVDTFRRSLVECMLWHTRQTPLRSNQVDWRSSRLLPEWAPASLDLSALGEAETNRLVWAIVDERRKLMEDVIGFHSTMLAMRSPGRILAYDPSASLSDGAALLATHGYFDVENTPPWDTWICYVASDGANADWKHFQHCLLTWVAPELVRLATQGIEANPEGCIAWATDVDIPFISELNRAGILLQ